MVLGSMCLVSVVVFMIWKMSKVPGLVMHDLHFLLSCLFSLGNFDNCFISGKKLNQICWIHHGDTFVITSNYYKMMKSHVP